MYTKTDNVSLQKLTKCKPKGLSMDISNTVKRRFIKDHSLPITIVKEPWFSYYLTLYDDLFNIKFKFSLLQDAVNEVGGCQEFLAVSDTLVTSIINAIKNTDAFAAFNTEDMKKYAVTVPYKNQTLYAPNNANRYFFSVDMHHANFQALRKVNCVAGAKYWEELLERYSQIPYFKMSKYLRQVVFGHLNPRRQQTIIGYLNKSIILPCVVRLGFPLISFSEDQCVIDITDAISRGESLDTIELGLGIKLLEMLEDTVQIRANAFLLKQLGDKPYYVKEGAFNKIQFVCCPAHFFSECYKFYKKEPLTELDSCTFYEGRVAKFLTPLFEEGVQNEP